MRGMLAGLLAGLCAFAVAKVLAEPQIARAERFEHHLDAPLLGPADRPLVSRGVQDTVGLGAGIALTGVALGGLFGLAFAAVQGRASAARARATAAGLAAGGFVAVFLIPFLKYPASPPSVGNPGTLARRTALYVLAVAVGLLSVLLAALVRNALNTRLGSWNASAVGAAALVGAVAIAYRVMPGVDEVPAGFPASVLWAFRVASAATQLTLWVTLGLGFGALSERRA